LALLLLGVTLPGVSRAEVVGAVGDAISGKGLSVEREQALTDLARQRVADALGTAHFKVLPEGDIPVDLVNIVSLALANNPELALVRSRIAMYEQRVDPAGAKKEPMLGVSLMNRRVPSPFTYMDRMTMDTVKLRQSFESYGKRITKRDIAEKEVELRKWEVAEAEYNFTGKVINVYFDLVETEIELDEVKRNRELLSALTDIVRSRYELNQVHQSDLLMVQTKYSESYNLELMLEEKKAALRTKLAELIGISSGDLEYDLSLADGDRTVPANMDGVLDTALSRHPENMWLETRSGQVGLMKRLAEKAYHPDYTMELAYSYRQMYPDMFNVGVMFNLPVYQRESQDAKLMETEVMVQEVDLMREKLRNSIRASIDEQVARIEDLGSRLKLYENVLIPQVRATFDASLASYQVDRSQFAVLIGATLALIATETDYRTATVKRAKRLTLLDYFSLGAVRDAGIQASSSAVAQAPTVEEPAPTNGAESKAIQIEGAEQDGD